ncbi:MAG: CPBP family intramembrane metalloprotease [Phycisphaera sp.]|nr:CPBP family intramembrane metalloprotease [Phycisphaera sp.]
MSVWLEHRQTLLIAPPVIAAAVLFWFWRGVFKKGSLNQSPTRQTGLTVIDFAVGMALMLVGPALIMLALKAMGFNPQAGPTLHNRARLLLVNQLATYTLPFAYLLWRVMFKPEGLRELGLLPRRPYREALWWSGAVVSVLPACLALGSLTVVASTLITGREPDPVAHEVLDMMQQAKAGHDVTSLALLVCTAIFFVPIFEEMMYRGLVQSCLLGALGDSQRLWVIVIGASLFTLVHVGGGVGVESLPTIFLLALGLGTLYERTGTLWPGIALHAAFNALNTYMALQLMGK